MMLVSVCEGAGEGAQVLQGCRGGYAGGLGVVGQGGVHYPQKPPGGTNEHPTKPFSSEKKKPLRLEGEITLQAVNHQH